MSGKPRLLVLNAYYWPGVEATAVLLTELCEALTAVFDVTVVTGALLGVDAQPGRTVRNGVEIIRVPGTSYDRSKLSLRALNYATYLAGSLWKGLGVRKPDIVMCWTDPPMIADIGLVVARRSGAPLVVVSQDVFPEVAVELRRLENPALVGLLRLLVNTYLRRADRVVAIGERMAERLVDKGVPRDRLDVIPNWVNTAALAPSPRDNAWAIEQGLAGKFVVMHSGNVGHAQNLELLVRASSFLRDLDDLAVVIIGTGARHDVLVQLAGVLEVEQVVFLPYQPREVLTLSLSAADVHFIGLSPGLSGYVVPSRLYGVLAAGRPVIAAADADSETALLVQKVGCGIVVPPNRPELLAGAIRNARAGVLDLNGMGERARAFALADATREIAFDRYREVLAELVGPSSP
jgi:colanic acid biosynthesis glycosyl transferase WcaI